MPGAIKSECLGGFVGIGTIPGKLVAARFDMRLEMRGELLADRAVGAIRRDDHIDAGQCRDVIDPLAEIEHDTGALAGPLQDIEEINPRRARKVVALKRNVDAAMDDLHVVAALMPGGKFAVELLVGLAQEGESDAREDDTPANKPTGAVVGQQPFGGGRASGTNGKAGSMWNLIRWVSARSVKENFVPPSNYRYPFMALEALGLRREGSNAGIGLPL